MATLLSRDEWTARARTHAERVAPWIAPRLNRRRSHRKHPVDDFLFEYYQHRPGRLARWHPGWGFGLAEPTEEYTENADYSTSRGVATVDPARLARRRPRMERAVSILTAMADRPPRFSCFGLHEWAMVYGLDQSDVRHEKLPLRLSPARIRETVDGLGLRCTHFDAYRFFTPAAALKQMPLTRQTQTINEQGGCLHAGMDLYRYAYEAGPFLPSELVADCFEHARTARTLDMRASPYDVADLGLAPIHIETSEGRRLYQDEQRRLAQSADDLRIRLLPALESLLRAVPAESPAMH